MPRCPCLLCCYLPVPCNGWGVGGIYENLYYFFYHMAFPVLPSLFNLLYFCALLCTFYRSINTFHYVLLLFILFLLFCIWQLIFMYTLSTLLCMFFFFTPHSALIHSFSNHLSSKLQLLTFSSLFSSVLVFLCLCLYQYITSHLSSFLYSPVLRNAIPLFFFHFIFLFFPLKNLILPHPLLTLAQVLPSHPINNDNSSSFPTLEKNLMALDNGSSSLHRSP